MTRVSTHALRGNWTAGAMCFPTPGNAFSSPATNSGSLVSVSILEMKKLRLREGEQVI